MGEIWNDYVEITSMFGVLTCSLVLLVIAACIAWWAVMRLLEVLSEIAYGKAARDYYKRTYPPSKGGGRP